uniref:Uncharacterized protein n=1 Tax=Anguilla anguilla TaxID=7936 RepID=A0A0E9Q6Y5_ANGAN
MRNFAGNISKNCF